MKNKSFVLFWLCYISYAAIYLARLNLSMATPALKAAQVLSSAQIGLLGGVFSVIYALGRLLSGILSDKNPPGIIISSGLFVCGICNLFIGFLPPFIGMLLFWSVNAFAQSMLWGSILCVIHAIYSEKEAKSKNSIIVTSSVTGNIICIVLILHLIDNFGLRWAFIVPGAVTLVLSFVCFIMLKTIPAPVSKAEKNHISMTELLKLREIQLAIVPSAFHGVIKDNITLWMAVYFVDRFAVDLKQSSYFILFIPIIGLIGKLLYPVFYKFCGENEHKVSRFAFILCILVSAVLCLNNINAIIAMICLSLLYAFVALANTSLLSMYPMRFAKSGNIASVCAITDFSSYLGASIASLLYGVMIDSLGYTPMFISWATISVISVFAINILLKITNKTAINSAI